MSDIDSIVTVNITANTLTPDQANFGTPLIAGYFQTSVFPERVRTYAKPSEMVTDGFGANDPIVRAATKLIQNPKVSSFKIGRRATPYTQTIRLTAIETGEGVVNTATLVAPDGTQTSVSYVNGAAETTITIATALTPLFTAAIGAGPMVASNPIGSVLLTATSGVLWDVKGVANLVLLDETADPGIVADLTAIRLADPDWYGLGLDSNSKAEVEAAAAWAEAEQIIFGSNTADTEVVQGIAGNVQLALQAAAYERTYSIWSDNVLSYAALAWMGGRFPTDPGSSTWKFKQLAGVSKSVLNATAKANLIAQDGNYYISVAGIPITGEGVMASGKFIDVTRTVDAIKAALQESLLTVLANAPKLPFTNASVALVESEIRGVLGEFQGTKEQPGALDPETPIVITAPRVQDVSTIDRANRLLPDIFFSARLSGAIHALNPIEGTLSI